MNKNEYNQVQFENDYSPVPTGGNLRFLLLIIKTKADSLPLIPRSSLAIEGLCPAMLVGTEHLVLTLFQSTPYVSRCRGQTVTDA